MKTNAAIGVLITMLCWWVGTALGMDAPKIGEIKGGSESLWVFLQRLPSSFEAQIFYAVVIFGAVGLITNYLIKWLRKEIDGSLVKYLFYNNVRGTLLSFCTTVGVGIAAITGGVFETGSGEFVGWFNVMWVSLTNGFMWDSAMNSGAAKAPTS